MNVPHIPVLRLGRSYESLDKFEVKNHRTGELMATVSSVNAGIIRKDLGKLAAARASLKKFTCAELIELSAKAGEHFLNGTLPFGDKGHTQTAQQYIETLSATSGLPHVMVKRNMAKIHHALTNMKTVLNGLSRGLDLSIIDAGYGGDATEFRASRVHRVKSSGKAELQAALDGDGAFAAADEGDGGGVQQAVEFVVHRHARAALLNRPVAAAARGR